MAQAGFWVDLSLLSKKFSGFRRSSDQTDLIFVLTGSQTSVHVDRIIGNNFGAAWEVAKVVEIMKFAPNPGSGSVFAPWIQVILGKKSMVRPLFSALKAMPRSFKAPKTERTRGNQFARLTGPWSDHRRLRNRFWNQFGAPGHLIFGTSQQLGLGL